MSVALESVARINALKNGIEATTGETYADLTAGVQALKNGYGQGGGTEEIENLIDQSGVLESTDGTATEKVEQLIDKAEDENIWVNQVEYNFNGFLGEKLPSLNSERLKAKTDYGSCFKNARSLENIDFYIDSKNSTSFYSAFENTTNLKTIKGINTSNATNLSNMFMKSGIETIQEPLDFSRATNLISAFSYTHALKEVRFVEGTINVTLHFSESLSLSRESVQSIVDGLGTVTTTQTTAFNKAIVLTAEQKATISNKGWTLVQ